MYANTEQIRLAARTNGEVKIWFGDTQVICLYLPMSGGYEWFVHAPGQACGTMRDEPFVARIVDRAQPRYVEERIPADTPGQPDQVYWRHVITGILTLRP